MTRCLNRAELIGHVGAAPELRMLDSGQAMATFCVATSWRWRDATERDQETTEWSRCVVFGPLAEYCGALLQNGTRVYVRGVLRTRTWEAPSHAVTRERTEVVLSEVLALDGERTPPRPVTATAPDTTEAADRPRAPPARPRRR